jgi:alpha-L-arabinofuranosidase
MKLVLHCILLLFLVVIVAGAQPAKTTITADASAQEYQINKNIYGHFAEHLGHLVYGGLWVGPDSDIPNIHGLRKDVVEALRQLKVPVLRWPGGCFADEYHWKDGIGPRASRPRMINTNWGGVTEDNSFGTHEFLELCELLGCEPYITGNLGSGTVQELSQWVEYVNSDNVSPMTDMRRQNGRDKSWGVKYWGVGNESWGCGGRMTPEYYVNEARKFGNFMRTYGDTKPFRIACGPSEDDYNWTRTVMRDAGNAVDALSLHYYTWSQGKTATQVDNAMWFDLMKQTLKMDELIAKHAAVMDEYDQFKQSSLVVDEWGTWYKVEPGTNPGFLYQQNTLCDALVAGTNLNIFNNHADRVRMANIAQVVNVLQAMILTEGKKMVLTPTYHVFSMFKVHQNAMLVPVNVASRAYTFGKESLLAVNCSASIDSTGVMHISLCNIDPGSPSSVSMRLDNFAPKTVSGDLLTANAVNAHNTFDQPEVVKPVRFNGASLSGNELTVALPPMSVVVLTVKGELNLSSKPAVEVKNPVPGLRFQYYEIEGESMPTFAKLTPNSTGTVAGVVLPPGVRESRFAVLYDGYIKISEKGMYTFYTTSDDGTVLFIDGKMVVNNDGRHAPLEKSGHAGLSAGYHTLKLLFFQGGGGMELSAAIKGPWMEKQAIPVGMLYSGK